MTESDESNMPPFIGLAQPLFEVSPQKPDWDATSEAMRWINDIEAMQGGRNGPTIKLRAAIKAMQPKVHLADEFLTEIERNLPDYAPADSPAEVICDLINERDSARAEAAALRVAFERECADGDQLCEALGVERTEGGALNVPRALSRLSGGRLYWMVEKNIDGVAHWWMRPPRPHEHWDLPYRWTTDSTQAAHFPLREAAEYIRENDMCECVVTEHVDVYAAIDQARGGAKREPLPQADAEAAIKSAQAEAAALRKQVLALLTAQHNALHQLGAPEDFLAGLLAAIDQARKESGNG